MTALSPRVLRELRDYVNAHVDGDREGLRLRDVLDRALSVKRGVALARKRVTAKKETRRAKTSTTYEAVAARANGVCECGCGRVLCADVLLGAPQMDHFFSGSGRRREMESVETCWMLTTGCHDQKTHNFPSAREWAARFVSNCEMTALRTPDKASRVRYFEAAIAARARLESLEIQSQLAHPKGAVT